MLWTSASRGWLTGSMGWWRGGSCWRWEWGRRRLKVRLRAGRLHRLHRGVYAVGHRVISREARWMAAVLFAGPGAVLSHRSAAELWGVRNPSSGAIEVTTPRKSRSSGSIHRHFAVLAPDEVTEHRGIPVTSVPRTLFDLAGVSSADVVEHALRESEYLRLHDRLSLPDLLARYPGRRGSTTVRECLWRRRNLPIGRARSWLELEFLPFLRRNGLPRPRLNIWLEVGGRSIPGRLPLAGRCGRRTRWVRRARHPGRLPGRSGSRSQAAGGRIRRHLGRTGAAGR